MRIAEILHGKGAHVAKIGAFERVEAAVALLSQERIGALVVVDRPWPASPTYSSSAT